MRSPFKFLDSFTRKDRDSFFGRDKEIKALYRMVYRNPLTLVYGLSGTGKSSLIQCGLASRFDGPDWYPMFIRRGKDINESLSQNVMESVPTGREAEDLVDAIRLINKKYLRPIYLIFDQFEELFILGTAQEQETFVKTIAELLEAELSCHIILIMREEYLGNMYDFERHIPYIFENRMRVERMNRASVKTVILSSFEKFNIALNQPEEENISLVLDNISSGKAGIQLPFLQVYLDMLYWKNFQRIYQRNREEDELPDVEITTEEINELGQMDNVLNRYLEEQSTAIAKRLEHDLPDGGVRHILDAFVSIEGTKIPVPYTLEEGVISLSEPYSEQLPPLDNIIISDTIKESEKSRILRFENNYIELAHDSLAKAIDAGRSEQQRLLNDVKKKLKSNYDEHLQNGQLLSRQQLKYYKPWLHLIKMDADFKHFIQKSELHIEEVRRKEQRQARLRNTLAIGIFSISVIAAIVGMVLWQSAERAKKQAQKSETEAIKRKQEAVKHLKAFRLEEARARLENIRNYKSVLTSNKDSTSTPYKTAEALIQGELDSISKYLLAGVPITQENILAASDSIFFLVDKKAMNKKMVFFDAWNPKDIQEKHWSEYRDSLRFFFEKSFSNEHLEVIAVQDTTQTRQQQNVKWGEKLFKSDKIQVEEKGVFELDFIVIEREMVEKLYQYSASQKTSIDSDEIKKSE